MTVFYIDYENVGSAGLDGIEKLPEGDRVYIFYSQKASTMKIAQVEQILSCKAQVIFNCVEQGPKNALDFQLVTALYFRQDPENTYVIISKDNGFDMAIRMGKQLGAAPVLRYYSIGYGFNDMQHRGTTGISDHRPLVQNSAPVRTEELPAAAISDVSGTAEPTDVSTELPEEMTLPESSTVPEKPTFPETSESGSTNASAEHTESNHTAPAEIPESDPDVFSEEPRTSDAGADPSKPSGALSSESRSRRRRGRIGRNGSRRTDTAEGKKAGEENREPEAEQLAPSEEPVNTAVENEPARTSADHGNDDTAISDNLQEPEKHTESAVLSTEPVTASASLTSASRSRRRHSAGSSKRAQQDPEPAKQPSENPVKETVENDSEHNAAQRPVRLSEKVILSEEQLQKRIKEQISARCGLDLTEEQIKTVLTGLRKCENLSQYYNYFRGSLGEQNGRSFYVSVKSQFHDLRRIVAASGAEHV